MKNYSFYFVLTFVSLFLLSACGEKSSTDANYTKKNIDSVKLCSELLYRCLSETKDDKYQEKLLNTQFEFSSRDLLWIRLRVIEKVFKHYKVDKGIDEKGRDAFYQLRYPVVGDPNTREQYKGLADAGNKKRTDLALKIAAEFMNKTEDELLADKFYQMTEREELDIEIRRHQQWYIEIARFMELLYPDFWGDTPKKEQIKWVIKTEKIARKYDPESSDRGTVELMAGVCGIIGIDFESNPLHTPIVDYLKSISKADVGQLSQTWDYLVFSYMKRDYSFSGRRYSGWALRDALAHLPRPKREVPSLDQLPNDEMYDEPSDIWKVYKATIRNVGKK